MEFIDYIEEMLNLAKDGEEQGIFFLAAFYSLLILLFSLFMQVKQNSWPSVIGDISNMIIDKFGVNERIKSEQNYVIDALYTYQVDGETYKGKRISPWVIVASHNAKFVLKKQLSGANFISDGRVEVFYNPKNPQKSWLIKTGIKSQVFTFTAAWLPFILYWFKYT